MDGMPSASQILTYTDQLAAIYKASYGVFGLAAPNESDTLSSLAQSAQTAIMGDGSTSYGLGAPRWQQQIAGSLSNLLTNCRYDAFWARYQPLMSVLDALVKNNLPSTWYYPTSALNSHVLDLELTRKNALHSLTPTTPASAGSLAGIPDHAGVMPNVSMANAPRVIYTLVSQFDWIESLPSPESTQVALSGIQNAYTLAITGTVPSDVAKVRVYRSLVGGATGTYYWDQDVTVYGGQSFPTITLRQSDATIRQDINPPAWASCMVVPEFAALFALSFAGLRGGAGPNGFGLATTQASAQGALQLGAQHMLSPINVLAGPASGYLGVGNTPSSAVFGTSSITGSNAQTYTAGALQTSNASASNVQGFAGAMGIQARIVSAINATCTVTISYTYLDAAHGQAVQTGTLTSSAFAATSVGSVAAFAVPAGRLVLTATVTAISGAASGAFVVEPAIRTYLPSDFTLNQPYAAPGSAQAMQQASQMQLSSSQLGSG